MMNKIKLMADLRSVYESWQGLLCRMSEDEIGRRRFAEN
jgi:hypothetical protein